MINQDYVDSTTLPNQTGKVHTVCSKTSVNNLFSQGIRFFILADGYFNNVLMSILNILLICWWCLLSPTYHLQHSRDAPIGQHEIIYLGTPIESRTPLQYVSFKLSPFKYRFILGFFGGKHSHLSKCTVCLKKCKLDHVYSHNLCLDDIF